MLLWVSFALLTLAVTVAVVRPLFARKPIRHIDDDLERRLAVFRDRRDEIGRELEAGRLSESEAEHARTDLLRQMAEELPPDAIAQATAEAQGPGPEALRGRGSRVPLIAGIAIAIAVPLLAAGLYRAIGSPDIALAQLDGSFERRLAESPQAQFDALVAEIEARLRENPRDGEAWAVLAEAYKMIGNHGAAIEAFGRAAELLPPNARLLADYAESTALAAGGEFSGRPTELLERALAADPNDQKAVALMGAARYRAGDLPQARRYLGQLLASLPQGSEDAARIGEVVARIDSELAARGTQPGAAPTAPATPGASQSAGAAILSGRVQVAPGLTAALPPEATLFVIARAAGGPPIPVAVLRAPATALPYAFELGDANAMDPSRPLSSVDAIVLEARISMAGDAARRPGDLVGEPVTATPGSAGVTLLIDRVVQP